MAQSSSPRGFTLIEVLIATGLLITALAGLAQLFTASVRFTRDSARAGGALMAAQAKIEALRALPFGYDEAGQPLTDPGLEPSPADALEHDAEPFADWLDRDGVVLSDTAGAAFTRRWRVTWITEDEPAALAIDVCVFHGDAGERGARLAEACLSTARVRQP